MIVVKVKADTRVLDLFIKKLDELKRGPRALIHDMKRLGDACYKYLKTIIPVSKLRRPHLRENFKIKVIREGHNLILDIFPHPEQRFFYAAYLDQGATVPVRFAKNKKAMRFEVNGDIVFATKAKGFRIKGIHFVDKGEQWLLSNVDKYIDLSLNKYL